jgi:hypothetical protein
MAADAEKTATSPGFIRRFDRWLLLREPLLWRTRLPWLLVLLSLPVMLAIPFIGTSIKAPTDVVDLASDTVAVGGLQSKFAAFVVAMWVLFILKREVGELAPRRHIATVVAVAVGSFVWLVVPSLLAYPQIDAIKHVGPGDQQLNADLEVVSRYDRWNCVPPDVSDKPDEREKLRNVLVYYSANAPDFKKEKGRNCKSEDAVSLGVWSVAYNVGRAIEIIREARGFDTLGENRFDALRIDLSWWLAVALGIGVMTAILSYPLYVWRRIFLRR